MAEIRTPVILKPESSTPITGDLVEIYPLEKKFNLNVFKNFLKKELHI